MECFSKPYKKCRLISSLIIVLIVYGTLSPYCLHAAPKTLTLNDAVLFGINNSQGIKDTKTDITKKKIALREAKDAIKDIRRKESTVKFSLLFNIKFPEKHGLPKEIELIMKVPTLENELMELNKKLEFETLNSRFKAESTFFDTVELMNSVNLNTNILENDKKTVKRIKVDYKKGKASKKDYDTIIKETEKQKAKLQNEIMQFENSKKKLSDILGIDVSTGYSFSNELPRIFLDRSRLSYATDFSISKDYELFKASQATKIANRKLQELRQIYNDRWGSKVGIIDKELSKSGPLDVNSFLDKYMTALANIEEPWLGSYKISLLFFTISIPKEWFKGDLDGIRYFEDQKYALFLALLDREKAKTEEEKTKKELVKKLEDAYLALKAYESAYNLSLKISQSAKEAYNSAKIQNALGKLTFTELEGIKADAENAESSIFSSLIKYNKAYSAFRFYSSNAVEKFEGNSGIITSSQFESGDSYDSSSAEASTGSQKPTWYISVPITDYKFYFGLRIPVKSGINATHFELYTSDGEQIGQRVKITETIDHLPIAFKDSEKLILKLYNKDEHIFNAEIDGSTYEGDLQLNKVTPNLLPKDDNVLGTWDISAIDNSYTSRLSLNIDKNFDYEEYSVNMSDSELLPKTSVKAPFEHLRIILVPEKITITLYKGDKSVICSLKTEGDKKVLKVMSK